MATAEQIITAARRRIGINADEEPLDASEGSAGLSLLQSLLTSWKLESSIKSYSAASLASAVTVTIYDDTVLSDVDFALSANLAVRMAGSLGLPLTPDLIADADNGKDAIVKQHVKAQLSDSTYDAGMVYMPSWRQTTVLPNA